VTIDPRTPVVIGVAQRTWRHGPAPEPLEMWAEMALAAAADTSASSAGSSPASSGGTSVLSSVDDLSVVHCATWDYDDAPGRLAERLGLGPGHRTLSILAGTSHQRMIDAAAERLVAGESTVALVAGGEALATKKRLEKAGEPLPFSHPHPAPVFPVKFDEWFLPTDAAHGIMPAWLTFALFESGRRAVHGTDPEVYRRSLGDLLARMSTIAADHPGAWFPEVRTAEEILTPTPANRVVAWPYTKLMTAFPDVDMASATLLTTHAEADRLGVPRERRVYLRGWAFARDAVYVASHPEMGGSPAMRAASAEALACAGVTAADLTRIDLYGCFTSAIGFAMDALGLPVDGPVAPTLLGGLPSFGGPSSNYTGHAVATMVETLRADGGGVGLVSGVGMHMTKHVFAVYGTEPGEIRLPAEDLPDRMATTHPPLPVVAHADGVATIAAYTVVHDADGPTHAVAVCTLSDGSRAYALARDEALLADLEQGEWIDTKVTLRPDGDVNVFTPV
jgi:acetyl-CoA C-acetyltransferase